MSRSLVQYSQFVSKQWTDQLTDISTPRAKPLAWTEYYFLLWKMEAMFCMSLSTSACSFTSVSMDYIFIDLQINIWFIAIVSLFVSQPVSKCFSAAEWELQLSTVNIANRQTGCTARQTGGWGGQSLHDRTGVRGYYWYDDWKWLTDEEGERRGGW